MSSQHRRKKKKKRSEIHIEVLQLESDYIKFLIKNVDVSMANSLRRACIAEVPTLAIENVLLERNDTVLQDEFICHRLGLLPLRHETDLRLQRMNYRAVDCNCDISCPLCEVQLRVDYKHDIKHKQATYLLTSRDVHTLTNSDVQPVHFSNKEDEEFARHAEREMRPDAEETQTGIRIARIGRGQGFSATCHAIKGTGKQHAKWSPVAQCVFRQEPIIELNQARLDSMSVSEKQKFVQQSPERLFEYVESTGEVRVVADKWRCEFTGECERWGMLEMQFPADDNVVKMSYKPNSFMFELETNGQMPPEEVVLSALEMIDRKCTTILETDDMSDAVGIYGY